MFEFGLELLLNALLEYRLVVAFSLLFPLFDFAFNALLALLRGRGGFFANASFGLLRSKLRLNCFFFPRRGRGPRARHQRRPVPGDVVDA